MKGTLGVVTIAAVAIVTSIPVMYAGGTNGNSGLLWLGLILFGCALFVGPALKFIKK